MVSSQTNVDTLMEKFQSMNDSRVDNSGVYVFVSFDIVNSTYFKSVSLEWMRIISTFYDESISVMQKEEFRAIL